MCPHCATSRRNERDQRGGILARGDPFGLFAAYAGCTVRNRKQEKNRREREREREKKGNKDDVEEKTRERERESERGSKMGEAKLPEDDSIF